MTFFRNREIRKALWLYTAVGILVSAAAFAFNPFFGVYVLAVCGIFTGLYTLVTYRRYRKIRLLSDKIDSILHEKEEELSFTSYEEGELAVLESEIQKMTVRLREQQQKLKDDKVYLADSIADISHQIRTPLTSINLLVQLLREPDITEERAGEILRELQTLLSRIDWLITSLLKISKLDAGTAPLKVEAVSFKALMDRATEPMQIPMELRGQHLVMELAGGFTGDLDWTAEAVSNIVKNCMEHTPEGGTIHIAASENALYGEICISDTGKGIAPEDLPHIFERFYKGKNSDSLSFGIGLALARMIVSRQNGVLKAENKAGGGAMFTMRFYKGVI